MFNNSNRNKSSFAYAGATNSDAVNQGLRSYMLKVYNYMFMGLAVSGSFALLVTNVPAVAQAAASLNIVLFLALLGMAFFVLPRMMTMSESGAKLAFFGYAFLLSFAISPLFLMYTGESIARTFFITASIFGGMSLYGYTTKKNLDSIGQFAMIGIIGVFFASLINMFIGSSAIHFITSAIAVVAIIALTAYDTQKIKNIYFQLGSNTQALNRAAMIGALNLYIDFVYMFIHLAQFLAERR